jgi:hypothetical protein
MHLQQPNSQANAPRVLDCAIQPVHMAKAEECIGAQQPRKYMSTEDNMHLLNKAVRCWVTVVLRCHSCCSFWLLIHTLATQFQSYNRPSKLSLGG